MILSKDQLSFSSRLQFLTDVTALESLCSPEAVIRLRNAVTSLNARDQKNFLRGYRLAVATPLHGLLWFIADHPELLGLQSNERLYNWLHYRNPEKGESLLSAVSDPASVLGRLCYLFNDLEVTLRRADGGLGDTIAAIERCRAVGTQFTSVLTGTGIVSLDSGEALPNRDSLLGMCMAERILDYLDYDRSIVRLALELVWNGGEEFRPYDDHFVLDAETHSDGVALFPFTSGIPEEWGNGFWFGCDLLIRLNQIVLPSHSDSGPIIYQDWLSELLAFVNPLHQRRKWPSQEYGLTKLMESKVRGLLGNFEANMDVISSKHRLSAVLGPDRARLMTSAEGTASLELEVILRGAIAMHGDSKVHLLLLTHSVASDNREWVSLGLRLPMYGAFSNASKWFLFYKMYHTGQAYDSDVTRAYKAVQELLLRFKDNLEVEEIGSLDSDDFLPLCTLPAFRAMRELSLRAVETNASLRSGNSELLAAFWLASQAYQPVKVSFKHASLGKYEYDAIGVKNGKCLIVEVKGANVVDDQLELEIGRFALKVEHLKSQLPSLTEATGCESTIEGVSGLFIFLGDLDNFKSENQSITLWCYDDFVSALKGASLPNKIIGLLDKSYITRHVRVDDFPRDPFSVGL